MRRPLTGALLGLIIGVCLAIVLQQQGIWPLDRLTVFLLPASTGLLGLLALSFGLKGTSTVPLIIALIVLLPMAVWGALGLADVNERGEINGGCLVMAVTDLDSTTVSDTSKQDPFEIDPDGRLTWLADSSPNVFMNYLWEVWVDIGGVEVTLDTDTEPNDAASPANGDEVDDIRGYASGRGIDLDRLAGVYKVGGLAATCDGFGFVKIIVDGFGVIPLTAVIIAIIMLIILIALMFTGRSAVASATVVGTDAEAADSDGDGGIDHGDATGLRDDGADGNDR